MKRPDYIEKMLKAMADDGFTEEIEAYITHLEAELEKATELNDITDGRICEVEEKWAEYKADSKRLDKLERALKAQDCLAVCGGGWNEDLGQWSAIFMERENWTNNEATLREAIDKLEEQP